ncbi:MAG: methylated-DNA--[protein]-cysteine S-methyltransferase [Alphaproteobacteria bacterium]|nr:methylated-DNA--[protein]-cysteine S-methyltransferase [Alphaproteobacteria bacterium]
MDHSEQIIADMIDYVVAHYRERPSLAFLAARAGYEPTYFQKLFTRKVGVGPGRFIQYMNHRHARDFLLSGCSVLEAAEEAGLSGGGRLHDLFVTVEAATPGEVKAKGRGLEIRYGWQPSSLGEILVAFTTRGLCWVGFRVDERREYAETRMRAWWPLAEFTEDAGATGDLARAVVELWLRGRGCNPKLPLHLYGTNFQLQVWRALLSIPPGGFASYRDVAKALGKPTASRAVGGAVGANPVSLIIPCHRVLQSSGVVENYGWGDARKKMLLGMEGDRGS